MAEATTTDAAPEAQLEGGAYEIIRNRLVTQGKELRDRLHQLNDARKAVFGAIDTELLGTDRISTNHNCTPRDMVAIGDRFIFGYNVQFGLKSEISLADVFAVYEYRDRGFHEQPLEFIQVGNFERDFKEIYRYYKNATFAKFFLTGPYLFMVFQVGRDSTDIKALKFLINDDTLTYLDNRSDHEVKYPSQHEFEWTRTTRDQHRHGAHPHISLHDRVFVETVGGDLTIKVENNTQSGEGIYAEDVEHTDQTLDDAEIYYAIVGNLILMKIRPYQEEAFRYIVFNEKTQQARRIDAI
ncbi:MAG: DNA repair ATPase, partial [Pirellulaceae bacterium]|nr:DNA repair ATPase [Pirellulaceae bacterium]